jgi:hypothetical protein
VAAKSKLRKAVDEESTVRCTVGVGLRREEVWQNESGEVIRYNLAFINHFITAKDNGRVLGYDNSHGYHHRHYMGHTTLFEYRRYDDLVDRFLTELDRLRKGLL